MILPRVCSLALGMLLVAAIAIAADQPPVTAWSRDFAVALDSATYQTINDGVALYNNGDTAGCYRLFQGSLRTLVPFLKVSPDYEKQVVASLTKAEKLATDAERALELRKPLDILLEAARRRVAMPAEVVQAPAPKPEAAKPAEPAKAEMKPEASKPAATEVAKTEKPPEPATTPSPKPAETKPAEALTAKPPTPAVPAGEMAANTKPDSSKPVEVAKAADSKPAEVAKPAQSKPAEIKPADTKPQEMPKTEDKPADTKPDSSPSTTKPAETPKLPAGTSYAERMRQELLASRTEPTNPTLWNRLGGVEKIKPIVQDFLFKASNDPRVDFGRNGKFATDDMTMLKIEKAVLEFLSSRTGGPFEYKGAKMATAHQAMAIMPSEYKAMIEDLRDVLEAHSVKKTEADELVALLSKYESQIVSAKDKQAATEAEKDKTKSPD